MLKNQSPKWLLFLLLFSIGFTPLIAQKITKVKGTVIDAQTKEPLPFVNVAFVGTTVGTTTDFDGNFRLASQWASDKLMVSYIGYKPDTLDVTLGKSQTIDFAIESTSLNLEAVEVKAKKRRYRKRNNPAVDLIRNVIRNKNRNRLRGQDYFEYDKYEKVELDINNITDKFRERKVFNRFQFIFDNVDTSEINGKPFLPIYIQETASRIFYRKRPRATREYRKGVKMSGLDKYWDEQGVASIMDVLYQDVNIYDNNINVIDVQFVSPLSPIAPDFYKFYILDTVEINDRKCVDLAFLPRNKLDFGFTGNIYITVDSNYTVVKADLSINDQTNINWVDDLKITQEFTFADSVWLLTTDNMIIDFKLSKKGIGFFGRKAAIYSDHIFNTPRENDVYDGVSKLIDEPDAFDKPEDFWQATRPVPLTTSEQAVYSMIDTLQTIPAFRNTLDILNLLITGYWTFGPIDVGPVNGVYSFNDIEGGRLRLGGETNLNFNKKVQLEGQLIYGFGDEKFKYAAGLRYSFNKDFEMNPRHEIRLSYQHDTNFPGQRLAFVNEDNFLLSFKRGIIDRMIFFDSYRIDYLRELPSSFSYNFIVEHTKQAPLGILDFNYLATDGPRSLESIDATEFGLDLRFAPNEQFLQGRDFRYPILNKYPVFNLRYRMGVKDVFGGDYNYHRVTFDVFKKFNFSFLGYAHVNAEVGKVWGEELPYLLTFLPRANQTYAYQTYSYNMMNFLEFVSDEFVSLNIRYYLNGFIFNKIPLFRRLKLREIVSFKLLYGRLTDGNNPNVNPGIIQLPTDAEGNATTFTLEDEPYMEASVGVGNIFKLITIDLVKRLNYLENPSTPELFGVRGLGIRFRFGVEF